MPPEEAEGAPLRAGQRGSLPWFLPGNRRLNEGEDPGSVAAALAEAGIPFTRSASGLVVNLSQIGAGQMPFRQAVRLGFLKLSRNR